MSEEELKNKIKNYVLFLFEGREETPTKEEKEWLENCLFLFAEPREKQLQEKDKKIAELEQDFLKACKVREQVCKEAEQACERKDKRIAELEQEKDKAWWEGFDTCKAKAGEANVELNDEIEKLKKQLEELPDKWCRNKDDYCPHLANLEKEKCELLGIIQGKDKAIQDLQKENAKLKTDYKVLSCSVGDFGELQDKLEEEQRENNGLSDNLTKAKEIIKKLKALYLYPVVTKDDVKRQDEILAEAEQFIKDSEVEK